MKNLIIVTGSSRGIGKSIASHFNKVYNSDTIILLLARDLPALEKIKAEILAEHVSSNNEIHAVQVDFGQEHSVNYYQDMLRRVLDSYDIHKIEHLVVVYNHGTLDHGLIEPFAQVLLRNRYEINLFSIWSLLAAINLYLPVDIVKNQIHVNISSGFGHKPFVNFSGQCTVRAAREMLFKCLTIEQPKIKVLSYEPGLVYTDMMDQFIEIAPEFKEDYDAGKFIKADDTAAFLVKLVHENSFETGSLVRYDSPTL